MSRLKDAEAASQEVKDTYDSWSEILTARSFEACYAIIAANWAAHGSTKEILANGYARWSMVLVFIFIGFHLLAGLLISELLRKRAIYADVDKARWEDEFKKLADSDKHWPYSKTVDALGEILRYCKVVFPVAASVLFILSILSR
jgi:hypothetical protein